MKLIVTLVLCLLLSNPHGFGQTLQTTGIGLSQNPQINSKIDNISYWVNLAQKGLIPYNPVLPFQPAQPLPAKSGLDVTEQMSTDVVIYNESGVTQSENSVFVDPNRSEER